MNDKFYSLPDQKQLAIINAALEVFAKNEYKHASTDLIAAKAGVSKGLLFYYFHNKKELYLFVYNYMVDLMKKEVMDQQFLDTTDFFELLEYPAMRKSEILAKNPFIMDFFLRSFYSEQESVSGDIKQLTYDLENSLFKQYFSNLDYYKFRDGVDPFYVYKMMRWMADGYLHDLQMSGQETDPEVMMKHFREWMQMFKILTYKEEFHDEHH